MTENYKTTIGLEIHIQLNTASKMFSESSNTFSTKINSTINEYDIALPGSMPTVNKNAIIKAIRLANALNMFISKILNFDRKNYFYWDLPKGYQITQYFNPIAKNGNLQISPTKNITINHFHLEEDTAKTIIDNGEIIIDYNRSGSPLIEIVTDPVFSNGYEVVLFLNKLKQILCFLDISDAKMENGSLRVDVNISLSNTKELGNKVEIKNLNSFNNVSNAIEYEIIRQKEILKNNEKIVQETRKWNEKKCETMSMRIKNNESKYRYIPETNIASIDISKLIDDAKKIVLLTPDKIKKRLEDLNINENFIKTLLNDFPLYKIFNKVFTETNDPILSSTWVAIELTNLINEHQLNIENIDNWIIDFLIKIINSIKNKKINYSQAKIVWHQSYQTKKNPELIIKELNFDKKITIEETKSLLLKYFHENNEIRIKHREQPEKIIKYFIGLLMKETKGQADPIAANKILKEILN